MEKSKEIVYKLNIKDILKKIDSQDNLSGWFIPALVYDRLDIKTKSGFKYSLSPREVAALVNVEVNDTVKVMLFRKYSFMGQNAYLIIRN